MMQGEDAPSTLRERVTTPGGTTAAGLNVFDQVLDALAQEAAEGRERSRRGTRASVIPPGKPTDGQTKRDGLEQNRGADDVAVAPAHFSGRQDVVRHLIGKRANRLGQLDGLAAHCHAEGNEEIGVILRGDAFSHQIDDLHPLGQWPANGAGDAFGESRIRREFFE